MRNPVPPGQVIGILLLIGACAYVGAVFGEAGPVAERVAPDTAPYMDLMPTVLPSGRLALQVIDDEGHWWCATTELEVRSSFGAAGSAWYVVQHPCGWGGEGCLVESGEGTVELRPCGSKPPWVMEPTDEGGG